MRVFTKTATGEIVEIGSITPVLVQLTAEELNDMTNTKSSYIARTDAAANIHAFIAAVKEKYEITDGYDEDNADDGGV